MKKSHKRLLYTAAAAAALFALAKMLAKPPADALTTAAQLQAQGLAVPPTLKAQIKAEHG